MHKSTSHVTTASARLPPKAATQPSTSAMIDDTAAAARPTRTLVAKPATVRASMSRPKASVPKGCSRHGAKLFAAKSLTWAVS